MRLSIRDINIAPSPAAAQRPLPQRGEVKGGHLIKNF